MNTAINALTDAQRQSVEQAIAAAERSTSAEIVVALATRSGRYDRAEDIVGIIVALLAVSAAWRFFQDLSPSQAEWVGGHQLALGLIPLLVMFAAWWIVGTALATRFPALARPFTSKIHREAEVRRRGFEAFHSFRVGNTKGRTGVLIYVSLLEHMAWVSGDEAVNAILPQSTWEDATRAIAHASAKGELAQGLTEAVALVGAALSTHFPRDPADTDELPNKVYVLD